MIMRDSNSSSMQLTRAADYAVRVMIHLLGQTPGRVSLPSLAAATGAPESFLSKVLQSLTHGGLLVSHRGQAGGFEVSARGRESSMLEVIEAVDGPIRLNVCLTPEKSCPRKFWCPAHPVWARAQEAMLEVLEAAMIRDLANGSDAIGMPARSNVSVIERIAASADERQCCECIAEKKEN